jgi:hypothetical protein
VNLDEFVALSMRLTGRRPLDRATAQTYLDALLAVPSDRAALMELMRRPRSAANGPADTALERRIIESWYTGVYRVNGVDHVATYTGALLWTALDRSAPGTCRGETGYWAHPPQMTR